MFPNEDISICLIVASIYEYLHTFLLLIFVKWSTGKQAYLNYNTSENHMTSIHAFNYITLIAPDPIEFKETHIIGSYMCNLH